ncbi:MAG: 5'-methylthioadenosine/adenosylhomocysteine nucleosidase [Ostreibacterium sp.]
MNGRKFLLSMTDKSPFGIIAALPQEIVILRDSLSSIKIKHIAGMEIISGKLSGCSVVIMQCGIGKVNAAIGTTIMINHYHPKAIINTGSAGGIAEQLAIGDVVIGDNVAHHDVDVTAFGYALGQMAQMPENYPCDAELISAAKKAATAFPDAHIYQGQIVSGDQFIASSDRFNTIKVTFPAAQAVEMEAAAVAQVCYRFNIPFVVVRAISDLANEQASVSFETFILQAGQHSAEMVKLLLHNL